MLMLNNGVLNHRLDSQDEKADLTLEIEKMTSSNCSSAEQIYKLC